VTLLPLLGSPRRRMSTSGVRPVVGVLALQGSFREHCICLEKAGAHAVEVGPRSRTVFAVAWLR